MNKVFTLTQAEWNMRAIQVRINRLDKKGPAASTKRAKSTGPAVSNR
ncbi:MAG TPA: hypothetical protein VFQ91_19060 [Bryobacteraceae bacterium]|nr:hypothetical protein [Bryobacteraceae bacterium]